MNTESEAIKLLRTLDGLTTLTGKGIPVRHLQFLLRVYLAGEGGTSHETLQRQRISSAVVSRLMQDFSKVRYDERTPGYDLIDVRTDPTNFRRKIITINARGTKALERILAR